MSDSVPPLSDRLQAAGRHLSASTIAFHRAIAARLGLNDTDHKCLELLLRTGPLTAGQLASRSGYTTGAVTGIANRLIATGLVTRAGDPADGRRVVLTADAAEVQRRFTPSFAPLAAALHDLHARYREPELELVLDYLTACNAILQRCTPTD